MDPVADSRHPRPSRLGGAEKLPGLVPAAHRTGRNGWATGRPWLRRAATRRGPGAPPGWPHLRARGPRRWRRSAGPSARGAESGDRRRCRNGRGTRSTAAAGDVAPGLKSQALCRLGARPHLPNRGRGAGRYVIELAAHPKPHQPDLSSGSTSTETCSSFAGALCIDDSFERRHVAEIAPVGIGDIAIGDEAVVGWVEIYPIRRRARTPTPRRGTRRRRRGGLVPAGAPYRGSHSRSGRRARANAGSRRPGGRSPGRPLCGPRAVR